MDDAETYLKRVSKLKRQHFGKGFVAVSATSTSPSLEPSAGIVIVDLSEANRSAVLPMKKRRRCPSSSSDCQPEGNTSPMSKIVTPDAPSRPLPSMHDPLVQPPIKRLTLFDKWFPGNTLKKATVEAAHAPNSDFVHETVDRITAVRERMITLRSGVEDLERLLVEIGGPSRTATSGDDSGSRLIWSADELTELLNSRTCDAVGEALAEIGGKRVFKLAAVRSLVARVMKRKWALRTPSHFSLKQWHSYLNQYGPESGRTPTVSEFIWMNSPNTTALFTMLTQRFLRGIRETPQKVEQGSVCDVAARDDSDIGSEGVEDAAPCTVEHEIANSCWLSSWHPVAPSGATDAQCQLLTFLRYLMPVTRVAEGFGHPQSQAAGYGVWLLACLTSLDFPLDPDTDRLVHDLFRTLCDQVRVLGEWKDIHGEQRGTLMLALQAEAPLDKSVKEYTSLGDIGVEEVRALYTLIVTLAKFFRQNQNRLIPL